MVTDTDSRPPPNIVGTEGDGARSIVSSALIAIVIHRCRVRELLSNSRTPAWTVQGTVSGEFRYRSALWFTATLSTVRTAASIARVNRAQCTSHILGHFRPLILTLKPLNYVPVLDLEKRVLMVRATLCRRCGAVLVGPHWTPPLSTPHSPVLAVCGMGAEAKCQGGEPSETWTQYRHSDKLAPRRHNPEAERVGSCLSCLQF